MKALKILAAIALTEIIIAIPVVTGIYAWSMLAFQPTTEYVDKANEEYVTKGNECTAVGTFTADFVSTDGNTYYQFKSYDNEVWWALSESEIGHTPELNTEYILTYNDNGTTKANKPCDCAPEFECECEVYDDEFVSIVARESLAPIKDIAERES